MPAWAAEEISSDAAVKAEKAVDPVEQFTGKYWMDSSDTNKEAYLFGIESAIAVNCQIDRILAERAAKNHKKAPSVLSRFDKGWMQAFENTTRKEIVARVNKWYADHPADLSRPVLSVIWYELIAPNLDTSK